MGACVQSLSNTQLEVPYHSWNHVEIFYAIINEELELNYELNYELNHELRRHVAIQYLLVFLFWFSMNGGHLSLLMNTLKFLDTPNNNKQRDEKCKLLNFARRLRTKKNLGLFLLNFRY